MITESIQEIDTSYAVRWVWDGTCAMVIVLRSQTHFCHVVLPDKTGSGEQPLISLCAV